VMIKLLDNMRNPYFHVKSMLRYSDFDRLHIMSIV
jgi:hypothetical protein